MFKQKFDQFSKNFYFFETSIVFFKYNYFNKSEIFPLLYLPGYLNIAIDIEEQKIL